jgi:uncharacterized protein (DUF302 family)
MTTTSYGQPDYGITRVLGKVGFEQAVADVRASLAKEGFGVITEIDIRATLKKKLDVDFRPYLILGACNPPISHQALSAELGIGLLLPCNVVVTEEEGGSVVVSAIDPEKQFQVVNRADLEPFARDIRNRLVRALEALPSA